MPRYVAFLRGMNLGGRRVSNKDLCAAFDEIGLPDASTFRASGNVVFDAPAGARRADIPRQIEAGLRELLGYEVPVFLRSAAETQAIAAVEPFPAAKVKASKGKLQVVLLTAKPKAKAREEALAHATDTDPLEIEGSELYWLPSGGTQQSDLDMKAIELAVGLNTIRTQGTIEQMAGKFFGA